jgi:hypothetical protein
MSKHNNKNAFTIQNKEEFSCMNITVSIYNYFQRKISEVATPYFYTDDAINTQTALETELHKLAYC